MARIHYNRGPSAVRCSSRYTRGKTVCEGQHYHLEPLEEQVSTFLREHFSEWSANLPDTQALGEQISQTRHSLSETHGAITRLTTLLARAVLSESDYRASRDVLQADREKLEDRLSALEESLYSAPDLAAISEELQTGALSRGTVRKMIKRIGFNDDGLRITDTLGEVHFLPTQRVTRG